ncbi:beta-sarcoglycan isoform X1 [Lethenteron reissneri]|uniref:beta-sarcoglycan isoform X1 n=2 Tax=Lethenteron reissneri TaxID=7753 RepID=UPI002AB7EF43|nr:beta-sarcoglycan isoform X1 [Lethenteron reissneri]
MASGQNDGSGGRLSMREKAVERRKVNKEHNSNFRAGYVPVDEGRLHRTGLRGRKRSLAICLVVLLFLLAIANLITTLIIWNVIRLGPEGCDSMEFHNTGLLRFKQVSDMGIVCPYNSAVGGRSNEDLVITGNTKPVIMQRKQSSVTVDADKTSVVSKLGLEVTDPRTKKTYFSTDYNKHEFHLPKGVKILHVQRASTERVTSNHTSDLVLKSQQAIVRGNEGVYINGVRLAIHVKGDIHLQPTESLVLDGGVTLNPARLPRTSSDVGALLRGAEAERYKLCVCADGLLFRVRVTSENTGCLVTNTPCGLAR